MELHIFGFIGDCDLRRYNMRIESMRNNNNIVYDLCRTPEDQVVQDMLKCDTIYVVGDYKSFSKDVWNCLALASVCGKDIRNMEDLPIKELNKHTVEFLRDMADGLENAYNLAKRIGIVD